MKKFQLDKNMVESIEFMRSERGNFSAFSIINMIEKEVGGSTEFCNHSKNIREYFCQLNEAQDEDNFIKCLMGYYEVKTSPEEEILAYYQQMLSDKNSGDYDRKFTGEQGVDAIEFVLEQLGRMDIIMKPKGE